MGDPMHFPIVIIGAGGTGLTAALAAHDAGAEVLVLERDSSPAGSTAMSTGMIPASGTPEQAAAGIVDSPENFVTDMAAKTKGRINEAMALHVARESIETIAWLRDTHAVPLALVDGFLYPGHSVRRMYGTPNRTGGELMAALQDACAGAAIPILTDAKVTAVMHADDRVTGVQFERPDGSIEEVSCDVLILACSGFAGNPDMVARFIPEMTAAVFHGHPGNKGDAIQWGVEMGAALADMGAYQGHGGLAVGHAIPILWPLIVEGGFQINLDGERFADESLGYSEHAAKVNAQRQQVAWSIFDERLHRLMSDFDDYRDALKAGAVIQASTIESLASQMRVPAAALKATFESVSAIAWGKLQDTFGRTFDPVQLLKAPFYAARVTGALFHTQGGLVVDVDARVCKVDGAPFPNLLAGGGAARGFSGDDCFGYLAGNGLLSATTLGKIAGRTAARHVHQTRCRPMPTSC